MKHVTGFRVFIRKNSKASYSIDQDSDGQLQVERHGEIQVDAVDAPTSDQNSHSDFLERVRDYRQI